MSSTQEMKLTINVWPQDKTAKEMGMYHVTIDKNDVKIASGMFTRDELISLKNGEPIEWEFNYPQGRVRL